MALENIYDSLTEEQRAKAKACTSPEALVFLAQEEGIELSDEQLEAVAGGSWNSGGCSHCPDKSGAYIT